MLWFLHILGALPCQGGMLLAGTNRNLSAWNSRHVDWLSHIKDDGYFGWWFQIFVMFTVHPYLGKIPILIDIFQTGCNRQLVIVIFFGVFLLTRPAASRMLPNLCRTFVRFKQLCGGTSRELQTSMESRMSFHVPWCRSSLQVKWCFFRWEFLLQNFRVWWKIRIDPDW